MTQKIKYITDVGGVYKVYAVDGELISRCGGVLALVSQNDGESWSITHTLTGACVRMFTRKDHAQRFARAFYRQLSLREKNLLKTQTDHHQVTFAKRTRVFVLRWKP